MSFTLYPRKFSPRYGSCCCTTNSNNLIAPHTITICIMGFIYGVKPTIRDIYGAEVIPLDTFIHQASGKLILRLPYPPSIPRILFIETSDRVKPCITINGKYACVECVDSIRGGYWLWSIRW